MEIDEVDSRQGLARARPALRQREPGEPAGVLDLLAHTQSTRRLDVLGHPADALVEVAATRASIEGHGSSLRSLESAQQLQQRGLACTVGSQQERRFTRSNAPLEPLENRPLLATSAVGEVERLDCQH